jgi:hypothetical protein
MRCSGCGSIAVLERPEFTAQDDRWFRCRACDKQFNERSATLLNRTQYPSEVLALVRLWRLRDKNQPDRLARDDSDARHPNVHRHDTPTRAYWPASRSRVLHSDSGY